MINIRRVRARSNINKYSFQGSLLLSHFRCYPRECRLKTEVIDKMGSAVEIFLLDACLLEEPPKRVPNKRNK